jgi:hypothetical protein
MNNWVSNYNPSDNGNNNSNNNNSNNSNNNNNNFSNSNCNKKEKDYTTWNYRKINRSSLNKYSAGILPYTFDINGNCLVLLGKDNEGDWSDFGGRSEFKDRNDEKNTASREFYEETLGSILSINDCIAKIENSKKIVSKTLNGSPYYMFLIKIDYLNYTDTFNKTANFIKYHYSQNNHLEHNFNKIFEKNTIRWVNINTLINCIENKIFSSPLLPLRGVFYKTIQSCITDLVELRKIN